MTIYERLEWRQIVGNKTIRPIIRTKIDQIYNTYNVKFTSAMIKFLANIAANNLIHVHTRFRRYMNLLPSQRKGNTLYVYCLKYGKDKAIIKYTQKNNKCKHTLENFVKRFGKKNGIIKYNENKRKKNNNKSRFIERYGEVEGIKRYNKFCQNNRGNWSLQRAIDKYGESAGSIIFHKRKAYIAFNNTIQGYISRFGEIDGIKRYDNRMQKMHKASKRGYSSASQKLFNEIYKIINPNIDDNIFFMQLNKEYHISGYFPDFLIEHKKLIIEYNGDLFHANPKQYKAKDTPNPFNKKLTAKQIQLHDSKKYKCYYNNGYKVLIVWDSEYKDNKEDVLSRCLEFIYEN